MAMPGLDTTLLEQHNATYNYGTEILRLRSKQPAGIQAKAPVWTPYRNFLSEALDYVTKGEDNECIKDGTVSSCIIDNDCGTRTYMDSEILIFQVAAGLKFRQRNFARKREKIWAAFKRTQDTGASLVVILGRNFPSWTIHLPAGANYVVLDHFRVTHLWQEKDDIGNNVYMVRLQKHDLSSEAWWTPNMPEPPARRVTLRPQGVPLMGGMHCPQCGYSSPRIYADNWMCLTATCEFFWTPTSASVVGGSSLSQNFIENVQPHPYDFDEEFLRYRANFDEGSDPAYALVPALLPYLQRLNGPQASQMRMFYRGLICHQCSNIVPKILWHHWQCKECGWKYDTGNTRIDLSTLVSRHFVSFSGHPPFNPECQEEWFGKRRPTQRRPTYQIDKWEDLAAGCRLIVVSPTNNFNVQKDGPDAIYFQTLEEANVGELGFHRVKDSVTPTIDSHFHETYGADYGFSTDHPSKPLQTAPDSIRMAKGFIDRLARWELKSKYSDSNSVQALAYMEGMNIDWHVDGENELGSTVSTLSLGGDATFHLRMRRTHFEHRGIDIEHGAKHWRSIERVRNRMRGGENLYVDPHQVVPATRRSHRPEMKIPLIHGSMVIMQGESFSQFYEHKVETKGPLRFGVTTRMVNEVFRGVCMLKSKRPNGQLFTEELDDYEPHGSSSEKARLPMRPRRPTMSLAGRKRGLPDLYMSEDDPSVSAAATDTDTRPSPSVASSDRGAPKRQRRDPTELRDSVSRAGTDDIPRRPLPTVANARRRKGTPGNAEGAYWTDHRYDRLLHYRDVMKLGFAEIAKMDLFHGQTDGALRTAAHRAREILRKDGHDIPHPTQTRAYAKHYTDLPSDQSTPHDGSPISIPGRRGEREMTPGTFGDIWTVTEEDELWRLRHLEKPPTYPQIAQMWGNRRTHKAYREKFNAMKRQREKREARRIEIEAEKAAERERRMALLEAQAPRPGEFVDVGGPMVLENAVQQPERIIQTRRGSKMAQVGSQARDAPVLPSVEVVNQSQGERGSKTRSGRSK